MVVYWLKLIAEILKHFKVEKQKSLDLEYDHPLLSLNNIFL